jgi:hypothetical protein
MPNTQPHWRDEPDIEDAAFLAGAASMFVLALACWAIIASQIWAQTIHCDPVERECATLYMTYTDWSEAMP